MKYLGSTEGNVIEKLKSDIKTIGLRQRERKKGTEEKNLQRVT